MFESAESLAHIGVAVLATLDALVERYFFDLSPYLLFFMPEAQEFIKAGRGTHEQQRVFMALKRDEKLQEKYKPFYEAATRYFRFMAMTHDKAASAKARIDKMLRDSYDEAVKDIRLDLVDPASL
jgi:hypothetical protein